LPSGGVSTRTFEKIEAQSGMRGGKQRNPSLPGDFRRPATLSNLVRPPRSDDPTATLLRGAPRPPLAALVRVLGAKASPGCFRLSSGSCALGAGPECDVVISDPRVSRSHVRLSLVPEGVHVEDLGSRNGTYYLGQRVERIVLAPGSRIALGAVEVALDVDTELLQSWSEDSEHGYQGLVGASLAMRQLFGILARLEGSLINVLVQGPSGVGKELVARAIHDASRASSGPLVIVNCGGIPRELVPSELFGHRRGAFTGAIEPRIGAFEAAHGGTLFLDEIGELPLDVQPVLLRALESGEVRPVGENKPRPVKVRIIAATNRDLEREVEQQRFREDLYYRLAVVRLQIPALRDRPEDVAVLARRFAQAAGAGELPADVLRQLQSHTWPGNARELRNAIQAYLALGTLPEIAQPDAPLLELAIRQAIDENGSYAEQKEAFSERFTKTYLSKLLARTGGNQSEAARISGLDRSYLGKLVAKYGLGNK
jgi:DNA-binding NtrC family response regulator